MATIAVFIALGGGAYAVTVERNSVGSKALKRGSVTAAKLKKSSVTSAKVKDGTLRPIDFAKGVLGTGTGGTPGPQGQPGASDGFQASGSVNYDELSSSLYGSTAVSLAVPPGNYFATASVQVQNINAVADSVACRLINGNGGSGSFSTSRDQAVRVDGTTDSMALTALMTVQMGQALNLQCSKGSEASGARINAANIVAVQIGGVSGFPE